MTRKSLTLLARMVSSGALLAASLAPAQQPLQNRIYPDTSVARSDIQNALATARREHKRVLLDFGGNWCGDCQVLNLYFHQPDNLKLLNDHFILVDVNVGHIDTNLDLGAKYGVVLKKGVPALAVLAPSGKVIYAQANGEFEKMRTMDPSSVHEFLEKWK